MFTTLMKPPEPAPSIEHLPLLNPNNYVHDPLLSVFAHAVSLKRDYGSQTEAEFVAWLAHRLPVTLIDGAGNLHVDLRRLPAHRTLFTAHTDTVHNGGGANKVRVDDNFWRADNEALGADDAAGIALLCWMICHNIPGYYIFFRGEECGGIGSKWLAQNMPGLLREFDHAVAFDRAGYYDVITHQGGERCCSDEFAKALADQLTTDDFRLAYMPCDMGIYTDTAEFTSLIPECTNLSVGYTRQHGPFESQDVEFLQTLAQRLLEIDWTSLPVKRDMTYSARSEAVYDYVEFLATDCITLLNELHDDPYSLSALYELIEIYDDRDIESLLNSVDPKRITPELVQNAIDWLEDGQDVFDVLHVFINEIIQ